MSSRIYFDYVQTCDDSVFTVERCRKWQDKLIDASEEILESLFCLIDDSVAVTYFLNVTLLDEVIQDAIIGMRKVTYSNNNGVDDPASFKEAGYLAYWWLRHKPIAIHSGESVNLADIIVLKDESGLTPKEVQYRRNQVVWKLSHINELVAVLFVRSYLYDLSKPVCSDKAFLKCKKSNTEDLGFNSFEEMDECFTDKLVYYFSYRAIAPKIIVEILEAYSCHPMWALTGPHWKSGDCGEGEL